MRIVKSKNLGFKESCIAKIGKKKNISKVIIKGKFLPKKIVIEKEESLSKREYQIILEEDYSFNEGDIVEIVPNKNILVLIEKKSFANMLFVSDFCNCSCVMCPQIENNDKKHYLEKNLQIIKLMKGNEVEHLALTGGEPTIDKKNFLVLLNELANTIDKTHIEVLTNGINLKDDLFVKQIHGIVPKNISFHVPLYHYSSVHHNKIIGANGFYSTIKGIYELANYNYPVEIRVVVNKLNYDCLEKLVEFIYLNLTFVNSIVFMGMEYSGSAFTNKDILWIDPVEYIESLQRAIQNTLRYNFKTAIYNIPLCLLTKPLRKYAKKSISEWKNSYLDECNLCTLKSDCCGIFTTSNGIQSDHIKRIAHDEF